MENYLKSIFPSSSEAKLRNVAKALEEMEVREPADSKYITLDDIKHCELTDIEKRKLIAFARKDYPIDKLEQQNAHEINLQKLQKRLEETKAENEKLKNLGLEKQSGCMKLLSDLETKRYETEYDLCQVDAELASQDDFQKKKYKLEDEIIKIKEDIIYVECEIRKHTLRNPKVANQPADDEDDYLKFLDSNSRKQKLKIECPELLQKLKKKVGSKKHSTLKDKISDEYKILKAQLESLKEALKLKEDELKGYSKDVHYGLNNINRCGAS